MSGAEAHAAGEPISACPYAPSDPEGHTWRSEWIRAEAAARRHAGSFGATDEDYRRGGMHPPERTESGAPVGSDPLGAIVERILAQSEAARKAFEEAAAAVAEAAQVMQAAHKEWLAAGGHRVVAARKAHRPCPRHGSTEHTGGLCRPCARGSR